MSPMSRSQRAHLANQPRERRASAAPAGQLEPYRRAVASIVWLALVVSPGGAVVWAQEEAEPRPAPTAQSQDAAEFCDGRSFSSLFRCIPRDLGNLFRGESLVWLGVAGGTAAGSALLDDEVDRALRDGDPDLYPEVGDQLGQAGVHFGVPFALYVVARTTGHSDAAGFAITLLRAQIANGVVTRALKLIPRARPFQEEAKPPNGSFPSGHTSASFATATVIQQQWGWKAGLPAYALASYVGLARLHRNHYLSDVAFGAGLGIAAGLAINQPSRRLAISPILAPGVAGVTIDLRRLGGS